MSEIERTAELLQDAAANVVGWMPADFERLAADLAAAGLVLLPIEPDEATVEAMARALCDAIGVPQDGLVLEKGALIPAWQTQMPKASAAYRAAVSA